MVAEMFKSLKPVAHTGVELLSVNQDLQSLLNPHDPLQSMALTLLNTSGDWATSASLLTLAAMDEKQTKALVAGQGEVIDATLRGLAGPISPLEMDKFNNMFKMWSMGVLSIAPHDQGQEIRAKIAEIGSLLVVVLGDWGMEADVRKEKCAFIRNQLRPLLALGEENQSVDILKQFLTSDDPSKSKAYEIPFNAVAPDLTVPIAILKKLAGVLRQFERKPNAN
jgi:hypothetical protein